MSSGYLHQYFLTARDLSERAVRSGNVSLRNLRSYPRFDQEVGGVGGVPFFHPCLIVFDRKALPLYSGIRGSENSGLILAIIGGVKFLVMRPMLWGIMYGKACDVCGSPMRVGHDSWGLGVPLVDDLEGVNLNRVLSLFAHEWIKAFRRRSLSVLQVEAKHVFRPCEEVMNKLVDGITGWQRARRTHIEVIDSLLFSSVSLRLEEIGLLEALRSVIAVKPGGRVTVNADRWSKCVAFKGGAEHRTYEVCDTEFQRVNKVLTSASVSAHKAVKVSTAPCCDSVWLSSTPVELGADVTSYVNDKMTYGRYLYVHPKDQDCVLYTFYVLPEANKPEAASGEIIHWDNV